MKHKSRGVSVRQILVSKGRPREQELDIYMVNKTVDIDDIEK